MDIKDVSGDGVYRQFLEQIKTNAQRATQRKGEMPRDHPPPSLLVARFNMQRQMAQMAAMRPSQDVQMATSQVPPHYPPCVLPVSALTPLPIARMTLEHHHRGHYVIVRALTPPDRMTAVMAVVEDAAGTALLLQLYNQPEEARVRTEATLRQGDVCIIKEPFFKVGTDGAYTLRVDHVSDILWLDAHDERVPLAWRMRVLSLDESSGDIRADGNRAVQKQDWAEAEKLRAIRAAKTPEERRLAHLNRSLVNLRLDRPEKALADAKKSAGDGPPSEKALFREARALYALGQFEACMERLQAIVADNATHAEAAKEMTRVRQRLAEARTGSYQFDSMYKQAKATPPVLDCATHVGPVAVRDSAGRGQGLFTTRAVKAGELLLCEKAYGYSYADEDGPPGQAKMTVLMNVSSGTMNVGGQADLITQVVQKLYHNPAGAKAFTELHRGEYPAVAAAEADGVPVVDTFLVATIISINCFGAPRSSHASFGSSLRSDADDKPAKTGYGTCGVWPLASRINHACVTNCRRSFIGDMQIVRACRDMAAGTELHFAYMQPAGYESYAQAQKRLQGWRFTCACSLCLAKKATPPGTLQKRQALANSLKGVLRPGVSPAQLTRAGKILGELDSTFGGLDAWKDTKAAPRLELWDPCFALGAEWLERGQAAEGLEWILRGLEAVGFGIVASPPRKAPGRAGQGRAVLEIRRWGQASEYTSVILLKVTQAYAALCPELCDVAREYAATAHAICFGERWTFDVPQ